MSNQTFIKILIKNFKSKMLDSITLQHKDCEITVLARGDCCSKSFIVLPYNFNSDKIVTDVIFDGDHKKYKNFDNYDLSTLAKKYGKHDGRKNKIKKYYIVFDDKTRQEFILFNVSNGYYTGHLEFRRGIKTEYTFKYLFESPYCWDSDDDSYCMVMPTEKENLNIEDEIVTEIVIIIGLPGSGKTYLLNSYTDYIKYDDCLNGEFNIEIGQKYVFADPRFTNIEIFKTFMSSMRGVNIKLIIFKNDKVRCLRNISTRENYTKYLNDINSMAATYNTNNRFYKKFNHEYRDVYSKYD